MNRGEQSAPPIRSYAEANKELIESFVRYMEARGLSPATIHEYRTSAMWLVDGFRSRSIVEATHVDVREYMRQALKKGLADTTVNKMTFGLRAFFRFLQLGGLMGNNPMQAISYRKLKHRLGRVLTVDEMERVIAAGRDPWERAAAEVLYSTGVRVSEFCNLRLEDVVFGNGTPGTMRVIRGKGDKSRIVLFGERAAAAIREYQAWRPSIAGFLFEAPARDAGFRKWGKSWKVRFYTKDGKQRGIGLGRKSAERFPTEELARKHFDRFVAEMPEECRPVLHPQRPYSDRAVMRLVQKLGRREGIKGVSPHVFRRSMACHMLANGADIRAIQELLGHALLSTTMRYTTLTDEKLQDIHAHWHPHGDSNGTDEKE